MEVKLSIVILTYNRAELLSKRMMDMIANVPHEGVEVVIIDGGSTDETVSDRSKTTSHPDSSFKPLLFDHHNPDDSILKDGSVIILISTFKPFVIAKVAARNFKIFS